MLINPRDDAPVVVGPYALFGMLATGGMATVHLGRVLGAASVAQTVAIKRLHPQLAKDQDFIDMFLDEARIVIKIRNPHVVQTLDVVDSAHGLLLVMEYVQGETLSRLARTLRKKNEAVPLKIAAAIVAHTLSGLHAAHQTRDPNGQLLNIVHRDVSPQNIMIATDGLARVLDFGVAKAIGRAHQTRDGQIKGKLSYMAPEQLRGHVDHRTDVFAASIVLWELVTGRRLFEGASDTAVLARVIKADIAPPSSVDPTIPRSMDDVVMRGLAPSSDARFQTAQDMVTALEREIGLASPAEVAAWAEVNAKAVLDQRRARVAAVEAFAAQLPAGQPGEVRSLLPESMKRLSLALAASAPVDDGNTVAMAQPHMPHRPTQPPNRSSQSNVSRESRSSSSRMHQGDRSTSLSSHSGKPRSRKSRSKKAAANIVTAALIVLLFCFVAVSAYLVASRFT